MHMWNMYVCIVYTLHCKAGVVYKQTAVRGFGVGFSLHTLLALAVQSGVGVSFSLARGNPFSQAWDLVANALFPHCSTARSGS